MYALKILWNEMVSQGSCHKRQKPQAPTPQAPIRTAKREKPQKPKVLTAILS